MAMYRYMAIYSSFPLWEHIGSIYTGTCISAPVCPRHPSVPVAHRMGSIQRRRQPIAHPPRGGVAPRPPLPAGFPGKATCIPSNGRPRASLRWVRYFRGKRARDGRLRWILPFGQRRTGAAPSITRPSGRRPPGTRRSPCLRTPIRVPFRRGGVCRGRTCSPQHGARHFTAPAPAHAPRQLSVRRQPCPTLSAAAPQSASTWRCASRGRW